MPSSWHGRDLVPDTEDTAADDLGPQSAAILERRPHAGPREPFEVRAGRARLDAAEHDVAHPERPADQMEKGHALGDEVAPALVLAELDPGLFVHGGDDLALDERHLPVRAGTVGVRADRGRIPVAFEAGTFDRADRGVRFERLGRFARGVDPDEPTGEHAQTLASDHRFPSIISAGSGNHRSTPSTGSRLQRANSGPIGITTDATGSPARAPG